MGGSTFVLAIIALTVVAPIAIITHGITRWRRSKLLTGEDEKILRDLWQAAEKMDNRIKTLERILDEDVPGWSEKT